MSLCACAVQPAQVMMGLHGHKGTSGQDQAEPAGRIVIQSREPVKLQLPDTQQHIAEAVIGESLNTKT